MADLSRGVTVGWEQGWVGGGELPLECSSKLHRGGSILVEKKHVKEVATSQVGIWPVGTNSADSKGCGNWQTPAAFVLTKKPDFPVARHTGLKMFSLVTAR